MNYISLILGFIICLQIATVHCSGDSLPKSIKLCRKNDPKLNKCLREATQAALRRMRCGIRSLGIPPLEPLAVNDIKIDTGSDVSLHAVSFKLHLKNVKIHGIRDFCLIRTDANIKGARLGGTALTPKLWFEADYDAKGKVLLLPINGSGKCNLTFFELETRMDLKFHPEERNGDTYWNIDSFKNKFYPEKITMNFEPLGNERNLGFNNFLNENWREVFEDLAPWFEDAFGDVLKNITNIVFSKVPINKIFLD